MQQFQRCAAEMFRRLLAADDCDRPVEHGPRTTALIEAIAELRIAHTAAPFRVHVVALENGEDGELQFGDVDAFEAWQLGGSRHGRAS
jgi:hypothetical protein